MKIPKSELDRRRAVFQKKLGDRNIGGALVALNSSMYYFAGTLQCQYLYIPMEGECLGLVRKNMERARQETDIPMVTMGRFNTIAMLIAENYGRLPEYIGLELDVLPAALYLRFLKLFSTAGIVDISLPLREARQAKSAFELELLAGAARQVDHMNSCVSGLLVEGMEEVALASELEAILRRHGHQGMGRMRGFNQEMHFGHLLSGEAGAVGSYLDSPTGGTGLYPGQPLGAGRRRIAAGEPVTVDYGGVYNGYVIDQTRLFSIGPLPAKLNKAFAVALEIQDKLAEMLLPGTNGDDIYNTAVSLAAKAGLKDYFMGVGDTQARFVGHGVGLEFNEFPILAKGSDHILDENYVVAIEPKFIFPGLGMVGIENTWLVTRDRARRLSISPDEHVII